MVSLAVDLLNQETLYLINKPFELLNTVNQVQIQKFIIKIIYNLLRGFLILS
jgi:hypothetical protein